MGFDIFCAGVTAGLRSFRQAGGVASKQHEIGAFRRIGQRQSATNAA
jgi:hypothetical protein